MFGKIINKELQIFLMVSYFLVTQLLGYGNNIYKLMPLILLILLIGIEVITLIKLFIIIIIPTILFVFLLFEKNSNLEGWIFVNIHLYSAIYSILIISKLGDHEKLNGQKIANLIIYYGLFILLSLIIEKILFINSPHLGKFLLGSQNLTSLILLMTVPFAFLFIKNRIIKYIYILLIVFSITALIKSRGLSFILIIVIFIYSYNDLKFLSKKLQFLLITLFVVGCISTLLIFNNRLEDLIYGNAIYLRLLTWLRFLEVAFLTNPLIGDGPSNVMVNFHKFQYIYPEIGIISKSDIFINPHSDWIHLFLSGGIVTLLIYLSINGILIYKFYKHSQITVINNFTKAVFTCYIILLISAQYDITNATFTTLVCFYISQAYLFTIIFDGSNFLITKKLLNLFIIVILSIALFNQNKAYDLFQKGNEYSLNLANLNARVDNQFESKAPHFIYIDTLKAYNYLNSSGKYFELQTFENLIYNSRKYNKYFEPSLHLSFQYFCFKKNTPEVLKILSDVLYYILVNKNFFSIGNKPENVQVILGESLIYEKNAFKHTITLTPAVLNSIMSSGANVGVYSDLRYLGLNFSFIGDSDISKEVLGIFLLKLSNFSIPLDLQNAR